jgi:DNA-binding CsgD family transcriptional regulator
MLRGRAAEQGAIDALLAGAREGVSGALVIRGEPGIGKTALLHYAAARADGMRVLHGTGVESEVELPFAGLHLLLRPGLDLLRSLPGPQNRALSGAFGLATGEPGDRFLVGLGALTLLSELAEQAPLLCLIDDAQWLDRASAEALGFVARRLDREGIVILFAARDYPQAFASEGIPHMQLQGLDAMSAAALLQASEVTLPPDLQDQLIAETQGNPLALLELPPILAAAQHGSSLRLGPVPLTNRVLSAFSHQVRLLPPPAQTLLLAAAAEDTGDLAMLLRAGTRLGVNAADLQPAETSGLVSVTAGTLVFRHPLIRAAVYHGASLSQRIAAHHALAAAYDGHRDTDRRAWHQAAAATGPDEQVAAELELTAGRAAGRSGYAAAAAAYERAAQLSEDAAAAARRLAHACEAALRSGNLDAALVLAERAGRDTADREIQARLAQVRASAHFGQGDMRTAHAVLTAGAASIAATDPARAFWMLSDALYALWLSPLDEDLIAASVAQFDTLALPPDDPLIPLAQLARWATAVSLGGSAEDLGSLDQVITQAGAVGATADPLRRVALAGAAMLPGRDDAAALFAAALVADSRARGTIVMLPAGLVMLAYAETVLGRHRSALISGTEGLQAARDIGQPPWINNACGALAYLAAIEGDEQRCRLYADEALLGPTARAGVAGTTWAQAALALLDLGHGRAQDALDRLETLARSPTRHHIPAVRSAPDHIEAAARLGQAGRAAAPLALYARRAALMCQPWSDALLARCQALCASGSEAERHYIRALALHNRDSRPFDHARTQLVYGEWLRRARRRNEARVHLRAALETFQALGSLPWAAQASAALRASGAAAPWTAAPDIFAGLTPQELQIVELAARGMTNRDIAAQLFLSPRTVAYHLYKAYPKLGITSRTELPARIRVARPQASAPGR